VNERKISRKKMEITTIEFKVDVPPEMVDQGEIDNLCQREVDNAVRAMEIDPYDIPEGVDVKSSIGFHIWNGQCQVKIVIVEEIQ